ncbi:GNAT family N-acetyltransferase [Bradyrhizobium yuanmingense]|uniref:GNAT family N-acetyltransferase n=1 Tax=Bradyrhizobium yuanmingense TaxID=108015 RepID=UPI0021A2725C|nr:GNAT family N-acetyltransferase [Bradyrhizobium sp. CB1024]UWU82897.1 GNAT family N-acetyltransferase [Bradyrhizobium sp. CB1024]
MQANNGDALSIKTVDLEDHSRVLAILTAAFTMCPLLRWLYPEPQQYLRHFNGFIEHYCGNPYSIKGAYLNDGDKGAILWDTAGQKRDNTSMMEFLLKSVPAHRRSETERVFEAFGKYHPHQPHWYVTMVAIDPIHQRSGLAEHLLRHATEISDAAQRPMHLEATSPHAMRLYARQGWSVLTEVQVGGSPPFFPMLRQPKSAKSVIA